MELIDLSLILKKHTDEVCQSQEYAELLLNIPHIKGRTPFDVLTSLTDLTLAEYPYLLQAKKYYKELYKKAINGFSFENLEDVITNFKLSVSNSENSVEEVFSDLPEEKLADLEYALNFAISLFPDKYKDRVGKVNFIIENKNFAYTSFDNKKEVTVAFKNDVRELSSFIAHEFAHLIEDANPQLREISNEFLNKRVYNKNLVKLSEFCEDNGLDYSLQAKQIEVFSGAFIDPYVGRTYKSNDNTVNTEVFSLGVQAFILNPVNFLFKDTEHFLLTYNLLKGLY